jgi:hypothetical protein
MSKKNLSEQSSEYLQRKIEETTATIDLLQGEPGQDLSGLRKELENYQKAL